MTNRFDIVSAFTNNTLPLTNSVNEALKGYLDSENVVENTYTLPTDHTSSLAADIQAYVAGEENRQEVADKLTEYWQGQES